MDNSSKVEVDYKQNSHHEETVMMKFKTNRKLFSQILTLKFLYPDKNEWKSRIMTELRALMEEYGDDISLSHIGFPGNWDEMI